MALNLFAIFSILASTPQTMTLYRGAPGDLSFRYWDVQDTSLSKQDPHSNFGRDLVLNGGPDKTILIRFGDLKRVLGIHREIKKATLILESSDGQEAQLGQIAQVLKPWDCGAGYRGIFFHSSLLPQSSSKDSEADIPKKSLSVVTPSTTDSHGSVTWKRCKIGREPLLWEIPGASGLSDALPVSSAKLSQEKNLIRISGLEKAVQYMHDHPDKNYGFALHFSKDIDIFSSESIRNGPKLEIEFEDQPVEKQKSPLILIRTLSSSWKVKNSKGDFYWPSEGEEMTYTAHVKNVSPSPVQGVVVKWFLDGKVLSESIIPTFSSQEEKSIEVRIPFMKGLEAALKSTILCEVSAKNSAGEILSAELEIYQSAFPVTVFFPEKIYQAFGAEAKKHGYLGVEEWLQDNFRFWNQTLLAQSRFSFAPEGCSRRVRLQEIKILKEGEEVPKQSEGAVALYHFQPSEGVSADAYAKSYLSDPRGLRKTLFVLSRAIGLPDLSQMSYLPNQIQSSGFSIKKGTQDAFPGLMGGGDTRDERNIPPQLNFAYEPWSPVHNPIKPGSPTDLYSATDVAFLQLGLGSEHSLQSILDTARPKMALVKAVNMSDQSLQNTELKFFKREQGVFSVSRPVFTVKTDDQGLAILPSGTSSSSHSSESIEKDKKGSLFVLLEQNLENGLILVKASSNGCEDYSYIKAWHLVDAYARGNRNAVVLYTHFNLPSVPVDRSKNLAINQVVRDSKNNFPAKFAPLVQGSLDQSVEISGGRGDWIELDLGRDRSIAQISLDIDGNQLWNAFEIRLYQTGEKPSNSILWSRETHGPLSLRSCSASSPVFPRIRTIDYYGNKISARYIRIQILQDSVSTKLAGLRVYSQKIE